MVGHRRKTIGIVTGMVIAVFFMWKPISFAASEALQEAIEQMEIAYYEEAKKSFQEVIENPATGKEDRETAMMYLAIINLMKNRDTEAKQNIIDILRSNPAYDPSPLKDTYPVAVKRFFEIRKTVDLEPPVGEVTEIKDEYTQGDIVVFTAEVWDNKELKSMQFAVNNTDIKEKWMLSGTHALRKSYFSTKDWPPGDYTYELTIQDQSERVERISGDFRLQESPDIKNPEIASFGEFQKEYTQGDTVRFSFEVTDDRALSDARFLVKDTDVDQSWTLSGTKISETGEFSTNGWPPGVYNVVFRVRDADGNLSEENREFIVKEQQFGYVNIFTRPWTHIYIDGKSIGTTPIARLKLPAGRVDIRFVNKEKNIDRSETIEIVPDELTRKSYSW